MINSMTGYGFISKEIKGNIIEIEIKSLNSKIFDYSFKIPKQLIKYENHLRNELKNKLIRGKIDVSIIIENKIKSKIRFDKKLFRHYYNELKTLSKTTGKINNESIFNNTMHINSLFSLDNEEIIEFKTIQFLFKKVINECNNSRKKEGKSILNDINSKIKNLESNLKSIIKTNKKRSESKKKYLLAEISKIEHIKLDSNRLEQELFYYLDKTDINEEISRLKEHFILLKNTLNTVDSNGKKLNFICQEINREINTIGSKCNKFKIQEKVISMKDSLEKIKEQLYNVL